MVLKENLPEILIKIFLTILLCGIIGAEREFRHKGAGLRTHILVGVGSTLIVLTSFYIYEMMKPQMIVDPTRLITGIVTGIGFLCGGTILRGESQVMGLTTAATLWIVSGIGMAVGVGQYLTASVVTGVVFFVLIFIRAWEIKLKDKSS